LPCLALQKDASGLLLGIQRESPDVQGDVRHAKIPVQWAVGIWHCRFSVANRPDPPDPRGEKKSGLQSGAWPKSRFPPGRGICRKFSTKRPFILAEGGVSRIEVACLALLISAPIGVSVGPSLDVSARALTPNDGVTPFRLGDRPKPLRPIGPSKIPVGTSGGFHLIRSQASFARNEKSRRKHCHCRASVARPAARHNSAAKNSALYPFDRKRGLATRPRYLSEKNRQTSLNATIGEKFGPL
jgi:hypothetical protein